MAESSGPAPQASRLESASNRSPRSAVLLSEKLAEARGHAPSGAGPPKPLQTGAGASSGFASESPRGRICTCVDPLRRRRPELLGHAEKMDLTAGLPPTTRRSKRRMIVISPREEKSGPFTRTCTSISSFAGSRPVSWTMKGKGVPLARFAHAKVLRFEQSGCPVRLEPTTAWSRSRELHPEMHRV